MKLVYKGVNLKNNRVEWLDEDTGETMQEWHMVRYREFVEEIEPLIGRKLEKEEAKTIVWLSASEQSTVKSIRNIINAAYMNGQSRN